MQCKISSVHLICNDIWNSQQANAIAMAAALTKIEAGQVDADNFQRQAFARTRVKWGLEKLKEGGFSHNQ